MLLADARKSLEHALEAADDGRQDWEGSALHAASICESAAKELKSFAGGKYREMRMRLVENAAILWDVASMARGTSSRSPSAAAEDLRRACMRIKEVRL
jgi:hypothetical protein